MARVDNIVYPARATAFLTFDAWRSSSLATVSTVTVGIAGQAEVDAFAADALDPSYVAGGSTVTGAGTFEDPYHFTLRPTGGWPATGLTLHAITLRFEEAPVADAMMEPAGYKERKPLRQFTGHCKEALDNLTANPSERTHPSWTPIELHMLVTTPTNASEVAEWDANKVKADALSPPMRCIPGTRVMPSGTTRASWFSLSYWATKAPQIVSFLSPRRAADDPQIELDLEGYGDGIEPSDTASVGHPGESYAAFVTASQPMFDALAAMDPPPIATMYPVVGFVLADMHYFVRRYVEVFGRDHVHYVNEVPSTCFDAVEIHRKQRNTGWLNLATTWNTNKATLEATLGGPCKFRNFEDADALRDWGALYTSAEQKALGDMLGIIQDVTRVTGDREQWGTAAARQGRTLHAANATRHAWHFPPSSLVNVFSVGEGTSVATIQKRGSASSYATGPCSDTLDLGGLRMGIAGSTFFCLEPAGVMPLDVDQPGGQAWTAVCKGQLPAGLAVDSSFLGQALVNVGNWNTYWRASDGAFVWERSGQTQVLATGIALGTDFRLAIARNGATTWKASVNGAAVVSWTAGANLTPRAHIQFGGGKTPGIFATGNMQGTAGFICKSLRTIWEVLSDANLQVAAGSLPASPDYPHNRWDNIA